MKDPIEEKRKALTNALNAVEHSRETLEEVFGEDGVFNTEEFIKTFKAIAFASPFVIVERREDGVEGIMLFQHRPRFYFDFTP